MAEDDLSQADDLAPEPEPTDLIPDEPGEETPPAPRDRISERFAKLTRALGDKDRHLQTLQEQINQLRAERGPSPLPEPAPVPSTRPTVDQYPDYDAYVEAVAEWKAEQKWQEKDRQHQQAQAQQTQTTQHQAWQAKLRQAMDKYPDWDDKLQGADVPVTPALRETLLTSDLGTDVLYYLASHEEEARALVELGPLQIARAIGRIEAQLIRTPQRELETTPPGPSAPAPIAPVQRGGATVTRDPGRMSPQEYRAWRERQQRA